MKPLLLYWVLPLVLAGVSAAFHPNAARWNPPEPGPGEVVLAELKTIVEQVLWVDARSDVEYAKGHIPGALLLNETHFEQVLPELLALWQPGMRVVVYCDSLVCDASHALAERLRADVGLPDVKVLYGGWSEWQRRQP